MTAAVIFAFIIGALAGFWLAAILAAASDSEWREAYLNARDRLWALEKDQEGA